mmetsp:Transcript_5930/g.14189  ORF Transcript_5930/g.14189 Transcript_5930/m.14189 type:complete len:247 (-) Transcript_5930:228-968(-)
MQDISDWALERLPHQWWLCRGRELHPAHNDVEHLRKGCLGRPLVLHVSTVPVYLEYRLDRLHEGRAVDVVGADTNTDVHVGAEADCAGDARRARSCSVDDSPGTPVFARVRRCQKRHCRGCGRGRDRREKAADDLEVHGVVLQLRTRADDLDDLVNEQKRGLMAPAMSAAITLCLMGGCGAAMLAILLCFHVRRLLLQRAREETVHQQLLDRVKSDEDQLDRIAFTCHLEGLEEVLCTCIELHRQG